MLSSVCSPELAMMVFSEYVKQRILYYQRKNYAEIVHCLSEGHKATIDDIHVSTRTVLRWRKQLGWTSKSTSYCQMIRDVNKEKRLAWAIQNKDMSFKDVIFSDESTIQIKTHRRTCCYKRGQKPRYKPKPKHPVKVHVWAGISYQRRTNLCIFEGKMNAPLFVSISENLLCPS